MEKLLTAEEVSEYLGVKPHTIHIWTHQKKIPFLKAGHLLRFRLSDLEAWLSRDQKKKTPARMNSQRPPKRSGMNSQIDHLIESAKREALG